MQPDSITRCLGLVTQYNPLATAPGSLSTANNCVVVRENIAEPRRGYAGYLTLSNAITQLFVYSNKIIAHNGTTLSYDNSGSEGTYSGTYTAPSGYKMRSVEAFSNSYFTSDAGVQVLTDTAGTAARKAGAPRPLDATSTLVTTAGGFLGTGNNVAYRCCIVRTDANNNVLRSYPSARLWVGNNTGSAATVTIVQRLPSDALSTDVVEFYRTSVNTSSGTSDAAGDEMALVYQTTAGGGSTVTFTDVLVDALRGATLYSSPSQEGIAQANDRPPLAKDLALYKNDFLIYANTSTKQRQYFSLLSASTLGSQLSCTTHSNTTVDGISSTANLKAGMTVTGTGIPASTTISSVSSPTAIIISQAATGSATVTLTFMTAKTLTIGGTAYSFAATEDAATGKIGVSVTGVAASDIDLTARSLVRIVNSYATNTTVYAQYLSGPSDVPGSILIEERGVGAAAFTCMVSHADIQTAFSASGTNPPVSPSTTSSWTSSNQIQKNAFFYSKAKQPEAVPGTNNFLVGAANKNILRTVALRESLIIIKEDGVYRMTGDGPSSFSVSPLDLTVFCKSADSVAVLANTVIMLSNQGVVQISDTGVQVISREIEVSLKPLLTYTNIATTVSAGAYESDRHYLISVPSNSSDTVETQTYIYNIFTRTWVRWAFGFTAAVVEPGADKLYFAKPAGLIVYRERKDFADTDYCDPESTIAVTAISGNYVSFTISGATPDVGWTILQGSTEIPIKSLTVAAGVYTGLMESDVPASWTTGAATIYPSVGMEIVWNTWAGGPGNVGTLKQVSEFAVLTDNTPGTNTISSIIPTFKSNIDEETEEVPITLTQGGWGGAWGVISWGGGGDCYGYRTYVPRNKQVCRTLNPGVRVKNARQKISIAGCTFLYEPISERIGK